MLSTLLELAGLAALVAGVLVLAGLGWALIAAAPCLMFTGYSLRAAQPGRDLRAKIAKLRARRG